MDSIYSASSTMLSSNWLLLLLIQLINNVFVDAGLHEKSAIVGGNETQLNEFPYAVAVISSCSGYICSGGIIGERYILSAAHCFTNPSNEFEKDTFSVVAGTNDLNLVPQSSNSIKIDVAKIIIPSTFTHSILKDDIAVLKLAQNLRVVKHRFQVLKLPARSRRIIVGERGVVAGFGGCAIETAFNGTKKIVKRVKYDDKLYSANVEVIRKTDCNEIPYRNFEIKDYHLLAKIIKNSNEVFGMCYGDSGSSLVYKSKTVIGVMIDSFDEGCDERNTPAVYTKVSAYHSFISDAMHDSIKKHLRIRNIIKRRHTCTTM